MNLNSLSPGRRTWDLTSGVLLQIPEVLAGLEKLHRLEQMHFKREMATRAPGLLYLRRAQLLLALQEPLPLLPSHVESGSDAFRIRSG